jgi:hypothetical protein
MHRMDSALASTALERGVTPIGEPTSYDPCGRPTKSPTCDKAHCWHGELQKRAHKYRDGSKVLKLDGKEAWKKHMKRA